MRLLGADRAIVDAAKVRDYLLSLEHPVGRFKAPVFLAAGYSGADSGVLQRDLQALARTEDALPGRSTPYGATVRSPWYPSRGPGAHARRGDEHGLRRGDLGAVVHVHAAGTCEVEFVRASGETEALVTLTAAELRPDADLVAVRPATPHRRGAA